MSLACPKCTSQILSENINIQTDIAQCISCGNIFKISEKVSPVKTNSMVDVHQPPSGTWYENNHQYTRVGASTRSYVALVLVPFLIFWSSGVFSWEMFSGQSEFDFFLLPFIIVGSVFWCAAFMTVLGKVEVYADRESATIFTGVWKIGRYQKVLWKDIDFIQEEILNFVHYPGNTGTKILLEGKSRYSFASGVNEKRRYFLLQVLKQLHAQSQNQR